MGWVIWITGLPGSGKTTISLKVQESFEADGIAVTRLELDEIRRYVTPEPTYSEEEREIVYRSLGYMAKLLYDHGINVIIDATANRRSYRDFARGLIPNFIEVYIETPIDRCIKQEAERDAKYSPKGIYDKSKLPGANVPGINVEYEAPENPEVVINTVEITPEKAGEIIRNWVKERFDIEITPENRGREGEP